MKMFVSPWKSSTPKALARHIGARLFRLDELVTKEKPEVLINWGCSDLRNQYARQVLNSPGLVKYAANKMMAFDSMKSHNIPTVEFTRIRDTALEWNEKHSVICHTDPNGHSGSGLRRIEKGQGAMHAMPYCPLFTKYFPKTREMRVLCVKNGEDYNTMFLEKKKINPERYEEFGLDGKPDWFIRTHGNGWIYSREAEELTSAVNTAKQVMKVMGLHYGAVDVMAKPDSHGGFEIRVGEINTAPGLQNKSLDFFKVELTRLLKESLTF